MISGKILIVDDQVGIRMLLQELFVSEGYTVLEAANGDEVRQILSNQIPDLVLLDMKLPGVTGLDLLHEWSNRSTPPKVILMTAYEELKALEEAKQLGIIRYFSKPFDIHELLNFVNQVFQGVNQENV
jgi:two-component system response regulator (stage 0 sporulation protein F)